MDSSFVTRYFRLDVDLDHVLAAISKDEAVSRAVERFYGLRIVSQEPWECLASFVLATNANIPRIRKMVAAVCSRYGSAMEFEGGSYSAFPSADALARATEADLASCGLGYRAPFLKRVAVAVSEGKIDFQRASDLGYLEARKLLLAELLGEKVLLGVGPKVADCVLLYSLGKDEAFPIDVWIGKILAKAYPGVIGPALKKRLIVDGKVKLSPSDYGRISEKVRSYFGAYAGYAQQYLYMAAREETG